MFKQCARSIFAAVTLLVVLAGSSALAANSIRAATARAQLSSSALARTARRARRKPGTVIHQRKSRKAVAASTVLLGDDVVESQSDFLAAGRAEAFELRAETSGPARAVHVYIGAANAASTVIVGLYTSVNGHAGARLRAASATASAAGTWTTVPIYKLNLVAGTTYWLAILGEGGTLRYRDRAQGPCVSETSANAKLHYLPPSWKVGTVYADCPVSAYVSTASPPPVNTTPPALAGEATSGQVLNASTGSWKDAPTSYAYQWQECNALGVGCLNVGGATTSSLTLSPADVGGTVRNVVTAANEGGSNEAASEPSELISPPPPPPPPTNTVAPAVSGTVQVGDTLTASTGTWTESPTSIAYQWEDCNTSGKACSNVNGATASSYQLAASDAEHTLRVVVTASNEGGANSAASEASETVAPEPPPPAPTNTVAPAVSGTAQDGQTLTASTGTWTGSPTSFAYQWQDCSASGKSCSNVSGATASTYQLAASDVGHTVRVVVTASNEGGASAADSAVTDTVAAGSEPAPTNTVLPAVSGSAVEGQTLSASNGTWTGSPTSFSYQWEDCNTSGEACANVSGATSSSYKLAATDVGHTLRVVVTASNAGGSTKASSAATAKVLPLAPSNTVLPSVSGSAVEGQTLSASNGTWTGSPTSFSYQWEDCNTSGAGCANVSGATSSSYKLAATDVGHTLRVLVTASNAGGSGEATSAATATVAAAPPPAPTNTVLPAVSGSAEEGQTLSTSNGTWTGSPTSFTYQWEDCNTSGEGCANVSGATSSSYKLAATDVGHTLRVVVTASNAGGSTKASSAATAKVLPLAPSNTVLPSVSGSAVEGQTLSASNGTWTGSPTSFSYQWEDCNTSGAGCASVSGATSSSYKLAAGDVGHTLRVLVTASNAGGSGEATSAATATVAAAPPPTNTALPAVSGSAEEGQTLSTSNGTWTGSPTSFAYQWEDCNTSGEGCANVSGATSSSYKLAAGDVGHTLRVAVTASNTGGSTKATSEATATVAAHAAEPQIFVSQSGAGSKSGEGSCSNAESVGWMNQEGHWGSGAGKIAPGDEVMLCGTITEPVEVLGSGKSGAPITILFTSGSKIAMSGNGCPGAGCINMKSGREYITITSAAGYKGQIENTERSYAREKGEGPGTKAIKAFGCRHCNIENLEIGPLYVSEKGDVVGNTEIQAIAINNEDGEPEYDTIQNNYLHDMGWALVVANGEKSGHIYIEHNTFYHLTHGLAIGGGNGASSSIGQETFAHNRFYGNSNWEDGAADTNHVDGVHCFAEPTNPAHYTGLYIYDNYITTEGSNTTGPIFLEGSNGGTPCSDKTSNVWIFNNVLTGNTCCGLAGAFTGEDHTYNNTMIGEGPTTELGERETCETWNSDTKEGRALMVSNRTFKNNVVTSCHDLISAERFLAAQNGVEHNLWANAGGGNEVFACEHGEVETGAEDREAFHSSELGSWMTCMEQPETESRYVSTAKLRTGEAQAPLGEPEGGSEAIAHGKNLSSLCSQTPEEALCKNINGETRPNAGAWNIGAY